MRLGDNLYSSSVLALNGGSGDLTWYFQFTPHDVHDWDAIQIPVLADIEIGGRERKVMMWANRNAFFYVLDRETGEFLLGTPFARQSWAEGLDENGRPIRLPNTSPSPEGTIVSPSVLGGTNWWSPAYSPRTRLFYVNAFDGESKFFIRDDEYVEGVRFAGGGPQGVEAVDNYVNAIRALDPTTGERRWEFQLTPQSRAGILATAGDVIFSGGIDGYFFALDAETGEELWHISLGARVQAAPITFAVNGEQYITIAAGNVVYTFGLD